MNIGKFVLKNLGTIVEWIIDAALERRKRRRNRDIELMLQRQQARANAPTVRLPRRDGE